MGLKAHVEKCPSSTPAGAGGDRGGALKTEQITLRILEVPSAP